MASRAGANQTSGRGLGQQAPLIPSRSTEPISQGNCLELEHAIGYNSKSRHTLKFHPSLENSIISSMGSVIYFQDLTDPHKQSFLRGHEELVTCLDITRRGDLVASGQLGSTSTPTHDAPVFVWDVKSKTPLYIFEGFVDVVSLVQFSPDGEFLLAYGDPSSLKIWEIKTGELVTTQKCQHGYEVAFWCGIDTSERHPKYYFVSCQDGQLYFNTYSFDVKNHTYFITPSKCILPNNGMKRHYTCGCLSHDKQYILLGTESGEMIVFLLSTLVYRISIPICKSIVTNICLFNDTYYIGTTEGIVRQFQGSDVKWLAIGDLQIEGSVQSLSISDETQELLLGSSAGSIYRFRLSDMGTIDCFPSMTGNGNGCSYGRNSDIVYTSSEDGLIRIWDLNDYRLKNIISNKSPCTCLAVNTNDVIVCAYKDGSLKFYNGVDSRLILSIPNAHRTPITTIDINTKYCVTSTIDNGICRIWQIAPVPTLKNEYAEHQKGVLDVVFDPNDQDTFHSTSIDRMILTYDLIKNKRITRHITNSIPATSLTQSRLGEQEVIAGLNDGTILYFDKDYDEPVLQYNDPYNERVTSIMISYNGKYVVLGSTDGKIKIFSLQGQLIGIGNVHNKPIAQVCFSPDDKQIVSICREGIICVWNFYIE